MDISAKWIWSDPGDGRGYNLASVFRREFRLEKQPSSASLIIAADSYYRLKINGQWICDGPGRSYPEHTSYDRINPAGILRCGLNVLEITVRYYGTGTFHEIPQRAGLLCQLDLAYTEGTPERLTSDESFLCATVPQWVCGTPAMSCQNAPQEMFDNSGENKPDWHAASVICDAEAGPWKGLHERDVRLLTRREALLKKFVCARRVKSPELTVGIGGRKIFFPGSVNNNGASTYPLLMVFEIEADAAMEIRVESWMMALSINGKMLEDSRVQLKKGKNLLLASIKNLYGHWPDYAVSFSGLNEHVRVGNPFDHTSRTAAVRFDELAKLDSDVPFHHWANADFQKRREEYKQQAVAAHAVKTVADFVSKYQSRSILLNDETLNWDDSYWAFYFRRPEPVQPGDVVEPDNALYPDECCVRLCPVAGYDLELCYDLGEQNIGFWNFGLFAPAGTVVDIAALEYISSDGRIQHTAPYRNSMRYICSEGYNRFTSMKRRSGRYIFITIRKMTGPVDFQFFRLVESTYPVVSHGSFSSSDPKLDRIYDISLHTLKLCMEDTFTDCPLYEQTLWVGDARNESLFAMSSFGAYDLVRRCIRLAGQSLERLPVVGCQVPSSWDSIIPIWSCMWGISVDDYYQETGDTAFVREVWPMVQKNLAGMLAMLDAETGLMKSFYWNLFDWSRTDTSHQILLQNSLFLAGALHAAIHNAEAIGGEENIAAAAEYRTACEKLSAALNAVWDRRQLGWPDSIHEDGAKSEDFSVHTNMLSLLYETVSAELESAARANTLSPRSALLKVSSPFAALYLYETLDKLGMHGEILEQIRKDYLPMVDAGADTVWESYPASIISQDGFPTRSHCHGWSAAPVYFLPRLVLGIRPAEAGCKKVFISPRLEGLEWAKGSRPTVLGEIEVECRLDGRDLFIRCRAPEGMEVEYQENETHDSLNVTFELNGKVKKQ